MKVQITEVLRKLLEVDAKNKEDGIEQVANWYQKGKISLTADDHADTKIEVYEDSVDALMSRLSELIEDLSFDYDRMSNSGKETYEEICSIITKLRG